MKPEVIVSGFPNTGTSFLCNLIVALGKSPGKSVDLKDADKHNRYGYFENLKLRAITYEALGRDYFMPWEKGYLPDKPYIFELNKLEKYSSIIRDIAENDNVEVYKDNTTPLIFRIFPKEAKYINIRRNPEKIYESPQKGGHSKIACNYSEFKEYYNKYQGLVKQMSKEVDCIDVNYEDFFDDLDNTIYKIAHHIEIEINDTKLNDCRKTFRPRKSVIDKILNFVQN